jgi:hypothetical protein
MIQSFTVPRTFNPENIQFSILSYLIYYDFEYPTVKIIHNMFLHVVKVNNKFLFITYYVF